MRLAQTSVLYFVTKMFSAVISFIATVYLARILGEELWGYWALILAVVAWLIIPANIGFSTAVIKRASEGDEPDAYIYAGMIIKSILVFITIIFVIIFDQYINNYVGVSAASFIVVLLLVNLFTTIIDSGLQGKNLINSYSILKFTKQISLRISQVLLVAFGFGLTGLFYGYVAASTIIIVASIWILRPKLTVPRLEHFLRLFNFAKYSWLGAMRSKTFNTVDIALLGFFTTASLVGVYSIVWSLSRMLEIFSRAISTTLFPAMSKASYEDNPKIICSLTENALAYTGLFLIPGLIGGIILGNRILEIYGEGFIIGTQVLGILFFAVLVYSYTKQLLNALKAIDRPDLAFRVNGLFVVSNILMNVLLIYTIGWVGAAIATSISSVIGLFSAHYYAKKLIKYKFPIDKIKHQWISALIMGVTVIIFQKVAGMTKLNEFNELFVILLVLLGGVSYFIVLLYLSKHFREIVLNNMPEYINR